METPCKDRPLYYLKYNDDHYHYKELLNPVFFFKIQFFGKNSYIPVCVLFIYYIRNIQQFFFTFITLKRT